MRTNVARGLERPIMHHGLRRTYYTFKPTREYDMYDWAWRIGFLIVGLLVGFLIGHLL